MPWHPWYLFRNYGGENLTGIHADILSDIISDILFDIRSDRTSDILIDIVSGILPHKTGSGERSENWTLIKLKYFPLFLLFQALRKVAMVTALTWWLMIIQPIWVMDSEIFRPLSQQQSNGNKHVNECKAIYTYHTNTFKSAKSILCNDGHQLVGQVCCQVPSYVSIFFCWLHVASQVSLCSVIFSQSRHLVLQCFNQIFRDAAKTKATWKGRFCDGCCETRRLRPKVWETKQTI